LCYGPDEGDVEVRHEVAKWLTDFYGGVYQPDHPPATGGSAATAEPPVDVSSSIPPNPDASIPSDRILITGGASQSLANILAAFTDPTITLRIWIVAPAYMLAFRIFEDAGFVGRLRAVPEGNEGIDIDFLEHEIQAVEDDERLRREESTSGDSQLREQDRRPGPRKPGRTHYYRHLIYSVPTFSNPSSRTMSLPRRESLIRLARRYDALLVSDDVYDMLYWPVLPPNTSHHSPTIPARAVLPRLTDIDRFLPRASPPTHPFGHALSNGSFSKLLGPGLRTGWVEGASAAVTALGRVGATRSGGAPSHFTACVVGEGLKSGETERQVRRLRREYARRWRRLRDAVEGVMGVEVVESTYIDRVAGGYFLCLTLPAPLIATEVVDRCKRVNLIVAPGDIFEVPGDNNTEKTRFRSLIRLCFAWEDEDKLEEGVERLAGVIKVMLEERKTGGSHRVGDGSQKGDGE
ncbi:PLP-dependent transferase, partial [Eremomyces bilateralis CBS 781.70]